MKATLLAQRGETIYLRHQKELERSHIGEVVAIDVDSGDFFVGGDLMEADVKAQSVHPSKQFYFRWIGTRRFPERASKAWVSVRLTGVVRSHTPFATVNSPEASAGIDLVVGVGTA